MFFFVFEVGGYQYLLFPLQIMLNEASNILVVELNFTQPNRQPCTDREGAAERGSAGPSPAVAHLLGRLHAPDQAGHHDQQLQGTMRK